MQLNYKNLDIEDFSNHFIPQTQALSDFAGINFVLSFNCKKFDRISPLACTKTATPLDNLPSN